MAVRLALVIVLSMLLFLYSIFRSIKQNTLSVRNSLLWIALSVCVIISVISIPVLEKLARLLGIETVSNMLFFGGFLFLIFICFDMAKTITGQNEQIRRLTQEMGLLREQEEKVDEKISEE